MCSRIASSPEESGLGRVSGWFRMRWTELEAEADQLRVRARFDKATVRPEFVEQLTDVADTLDAYELPSWPPDSS